MVKGPETEVELLGSVSGRALSSLSTYGVLPRILLLESRSTSGIVCDYLKSRPFFFDLGSSSESVDERSADGRLTIPLSEFRWPFDDLIIYCSIYVSFRSSNYSELGIKAAEFFVLAPSLLFKFIVSKSGMSCLLEDCFSDVYRIEACDLLDGFWVPNKLVLRLVLTMTC